MPNSSHLSHTASKTFNISVIGPQKAGKSCFCNRFTSSHPDNYHQDHTSVLNTVDFSNEIINRDHWLYWGSVSRQVEDCMVHFRIMEQTEFIDDTTYQSFHSQFTGLDPTIVNFVHRSTSLHLSSSNKLKYICNEQFGHEDNYEKEYFPSDGVEVNGFILMCEPFTDSKSADNLRMVQAFLSLINKCKRPAVVAISKCDTTGLSQDYFSFLRKSMELKKIPLLQTSAHENVNVEQTFFTLAKLIEKPRTTKPKVLSYHEALDERDKRIEFVYRAFLEFISNCSSHFLTSWESFVSQYGEHRPVNTYIHIVGSTAAQECFEMHVKEKNRVLKLLQLRKIPEILSKLVPSLDSIGAKSTEEVIAYLRSHNDFYKYFTENTDGRNGCHPSSSDSDSMFLMSSADDRIPFDLVLGSTEDDNQSLTSPLFAHLNELMIIEQRHSQQVLLETALHQYQLSHSFHHYKQNTQMVILPGQPMSEDHKALTIFRTSDLTTEYKQLVYKHFQEGLRIRAREDYLDLLLEHTGNLAQAVSVYLQQLHNGHRNQAVEQAGLLSSGVGSWLDVNNSLLPSVTTATGSAATPPQLPALVQTQPHALCCYYRQDAAHYPAGDCGLHLFHSHLASTGTSIQPPPPPPPRGLKEMQLSWLEYRLAQDSRYQAMAYLPSEKQALLTSQFDLLLPIPSQACYGHLSNISSSHPSSLSGTPTNSGEAKAGRRYSLVPGCTPSNSLPVTRPIIRPYHLSTRSAQLPKFSHNTVHTLDSGSSLTCPSLPWGGCIDQLMRRLAYRHLPSSANRFQRTFSAGRLHRESVSTCCCAPPAGSSGLLPPPSANTELLLPLLAPVYASIASNRSLPWPPVVLSIAVVCICSDSLAAHAAVRFLASAGFALNTQTAPPGAGEPLSDGCQLIVPPPLPSRRGKSVSFEASDCSLGEVSALSLPEEPDNHCPVVISSPWPLATDRLPSVRQVNVEKSDAPATANHQGERRRSRFQNGLVQASLMSLHKMLNIQLHSNLHHSVSSLTSTDTSDPSSSETSAQLPGPLRRHSPYDGFIFVVTAPSDSESNSEGESGASGDVITNFSGTESGNQSHAVDRQEGKNSNILSTSRARQAFRARTHSFDAEEAELEDCARTPQPGVHLPFFPIGDPSAPQVASVDPPPPPEGRDQNPPLSDCVHLQPCRCCLLVTGKRRISKGCHCSSCCQCPYTLTGRPRLSVQQAATKASATAAARPSQDLDMAAGEMAPRRRRWQARVSAVNAALYQVPKETPHLVLLADQFPVSASGPSKTTPDSRTWPLLYPAHKSWFSRTEQSTPISSSDSFLSVDESRSAECSVLPSTVNGRCPVQHDPTSSSQSSSVSGDDEDQEYFKNLGPVNPSDWIPAGTSVLDHVIHFLADCWDHFDLGMARARNSEHAESNLKAVAKPSPTQPPRCSATGRPASIGFISAPEPTSKPCSSPSTCLSAESGEPGSEKVVNTSGGLGGGLLTTGRRVFKRISAGARRNQNRLSTTAAATTTPTSGLGSAATARAHTDRNPVQVGLQVSSNELTAPLSIGVVEPISGLLPPPPLSSCDSPKWWNQLHPGGTRLTGDPDDRLHCASWTVGGCHLGTQARTLRTQVAASASAPRATTATASSGSVDSLYAATSGQDSRAGLPELPTLGYQHREDVTGQQRATEGLSSAGQQSVSCGDPGQRFSVSHCPSLGSTEGRREPSPLVHDSVLLTGTPTPSGQVAYGEGNAATLNCSSDGGGAGQQHLTSLSPDRRSTAELVDTANQSLPATHLISQVSFEEPSSSVVPDNHPEARGTGRTTAPGPGHPDQPMDSPVYRQDTLQHRLSVAGSEETHSIYEELDMLLTPTGKPLSTTSNPYANTTLSRGLTTAAPVGDNCDLCLDQEHIYAEVVDCLTVAHLERHYCSREKWPPSNPTGLPTANTSTVNAKTNAATYQIGGPGPANGMPRSLPLTFTAVSSSDASCCESTSQQRSEDSSSQGWSDTRRERYRSFSNPEGGSCLIDPRQARTSIPSPLVIEQTSADSITKTRQCHSLSLDVGLHHPSEVKAMPSTSGAVSNNLDSCVGDSSGDSLSVGVATSPTGAQPTPRAAPGRRHRRHNQHRHRHHHHFWHHRLCPHYRLHGGCSISAVAEAARNPLETGPEVGAVDQRSRPFTMSGGTSPLTASPSAVNGGGGGGKSSEGVSLRRLKQRSIPGFSSSERISKSSLAMPLGAASTRETVYSLPLESPQLTNSTGLSISSGNVTATFANWKDLKWIKRGKKLGLFHSRRPNDSRRASQTGSPPPHKGATANPRPLFTSLPGDEQVHWALPTGANSPECPPGQSDGPVVTSQQYCLRRLIFSSSPARVVENRAGVSSPRTDATSRLPVGRGQSPDQPPSSFASTPASVTRLCRDVTATPQQPTSPQAPPRSATLLGQDSPCPVLNPPSSRLSEGARRTAESRQSPGRPAVM